LELSAYDYFILDTSAGISSQVLSFCRASHEMILVATPEPTSLTDAYSLLKVLSKHPGLPRIKVVINHVKTASTAKKAYARLKETVHKFLPLEISPLGIVAQDHNVPISVVSQIPFFMLFPDTDASRCIRSIALKLVKDPLGKSMPMELFWDRCLGFLSPQNKTGSKTRGKKGSAGQTPGKDQTNVWPKDNQADLKERMSSLENKMSLLLEGMGEIKALLRGYRFETKETDKNTSRAPLSWKPALPAPEQIPLDFESWIKKQV
jgi:flagellar biosynthesis protein FlhG